MGVVGSLGDGGIKGSLGYSARVPWIFRNLPPGRFTDKLPGIETGRNAAIGTPEVPFP